MSCIIHRAGAELFFLHKREFMEVWTQGQRGCQASAGRRQASDVVRLPEHGLGQGDHGVEAGLGLFSYEGARSFVTDISCNYRDSPYKREWGRQNDEIPSSKLACVRSTAHCSSLPQAYGYTRARRHSSLIFVVPIGIIHINENGEGE